jgi:hypothetical protein
VLAVAGLLNGCSTAAGISGKQARAADIQDQLVAMDGQTWVVGMHLVTVSPDASVSGTPSVGDQVRVSGHRTESGELVIDHVQILADAPPASTSAEPATDNPPPHDVTSPAPQARPPAPESGRSADKGTKPGKGHKGS